MVKQDSSRVIVQRSSIFSLNESIASLPIFLRDKIRNNQNKQNDILTSWHETRVHYVFLHLGSVGFSELQTDNQGSL